MPNFTCPSAPAGSWHACASGSKFVGCCTQQDPCGLGCSAGNLVAASFDTALYGRIPDLECAAGAQFYTCTGTSPPFWGCCKSNPCAQQGGCPAADLSPASLGANPQAPAFYAPTGSVVASTAATGRVHGSGAPAAAPAGHSDRTVVVAAAAGGVIGGIAVVLVILLVAWRRRLRARRGQKDRMITAAFDSFSGEAKGFPTSGGYAAAARHEQQQQQQEPVDGRGPPPRYSTLQPQAAPVFEMEGSGADHGQQQQRRPSELASEPVAAPAELDAEPPESPVIGSFSHDRRSAGGGFSSTTWRPVITAPAPGEAKEAPPQSAALSGGDERPSPAVGSPQSPLPSGQFTPITEGKSHFQEHR